MSEESSTADFTAQEQKFLITLLKNFSGEMNANWDAIATELNYQNAQVARARWNTIRRNKIVPKNSTSPAGGVTKASGGSGKKGGAKKVTANEEGETPTKKRGGGRKKKSVTPVVESEDEEVKIKEEKENMAGDGEEIEDEA